MRLDSEYDFGDTATGSKVHIVAFGGAPSALILGSDNYDADVHARAVCGTISDFEECDEPEDKSGYCYPCVRTAIARDFADDADPFEAEDATTRERHTSDRYKDTE